MGKFIPKDTFFKKAKEEGYRARSAYKLKEIQAKFHLFGRGARVLDLGCSPGSWLQVIAETVGPEGIAVGIDILPVAPLQRNNVRTLQKDIREFDTEELTALLDQKKVDAVTCDIAPNLSGIREVDNRRVEDLFEAVKLVVAEVLKDGGNFVFKSFFSDDFKSSTNDLKRMFKKVTVFKPLSSRKGSSEIYLVCTDKVSGLSSISRTL